MGRRRLLFLSHLLPWPPDSGAAIRTFNVLKLLAREFDVTALCFYRRDPHPGSPGLAERVRELSKVAPTEAFEVPQQLSRARLVWDHLRSLLTWRPYTYYVHDSSAFAASLERHLATGEFDMVHMDSLDLIRFLPLLRGLPVACTHHNVESALLRRRADTVGAPLRAYMRFQARLVEREEREWLPRVQLNLAVSPQDEADLSSLAPTGRYATIPNGVDTEFFSPAESTGAESGSVFVGGTNWFPNRDGLEWFAADVLPRIRQLGESSPVRWVGHATAEEQREFGGRQGLELTGYVTDIRPYVHAAACFVVPLRVGGGTRLKVLDAWAMGKAVVSTSVGCEGLATEHERNILIADSADDFARCVLRVLEDDALRRRLGSEARRTAVARYGWEVLGRELAALYYSVLERPERVAV